MSKRMYANFTDEAYEALRNGEAVDNNGLRAKNGTYYPDQPTFSPIDESQEQLKKAGLEMLVAAGAYTTFEIVLPFMKRFAMEKVYPFVTEKWDEWREYCQEKKAAKKTQPLAESQKAPQLENSVDDADSSEKSNAPQIINIDDYRKRA